MAAPTVADLSHHIQGIDYPRLVTEQISSWASGHFDRGQATWPNPFRSQPPFVAWRAYAALDRTPSMLGLGSMRDFASALPETADETISTCVERLGLATEELDLYFQRLLMRVSGWAGHVRWTGWSAELAGKGPAGLDALLAISLAWECLLLESDSKVEDAWRIAKHELATASRPNPEREIDRALHRAFEIATQRRLSMQLAGSGDAEAANTQAEAQVVFCIDVRSERMRRAVEACSSRIQTLGFAGFFGMGIEWVPLGEESGVASCPVLLEPGHIVQESCEDRAKQIAKKRLSGSIARAYHAFKTAAVSSFGFVETIGLAYGVKLVSDSLALGHGSPKRKTDLQPSFEVEALGHRIAGIDLEDRVALAEGALRGMSLTQDFAPLVVFAAHGSSTTNNPYAAGLDCGACGGRSGAPNARVAAGILNDPAVRGELSARGIQIPDSTLFLAAEHDTTTDIVTLCDREAISGEYGPAAADLEEVFRQAGALARSERAPSLAAPADDGEALLARARDWSQVRPEWGLAGCTSFVAAPRRHTAGAELEASAFLHEYESRSDPEATVLEAIMTAPLVVASWINLQYFASTVDNRAFGAGNKVLHNVAGGIGVIEGNGGDLRVGLPMQSVHDGDRFVHRPSRLTAAIAAPIESINGVIAKHALLRDLLDHGWVHLVALSESGVITHRYEGGLQWSEWEQARTAEEAA